LGDEPELAAAPAVVDELPMFMPDMPLPDPEPLDADVLIAGRLDPAHPAMSRQTTPASATDARRRRTSASGR
ncbi:MAG: hypothetical protein WAK93_14145, partial [Solirubrobacteraceae bacterium]